MPEHIRALIVILALAAGVFAFARRPATDLIQLSDFTRRRNLWFALSLLAFTSHSFWVYAGITAIALAFARKRENNAMALFFILLFLIPPAPTEIPGFGLINYLLDLNHIRLLALCVLLPAFLTLRKRPGIAPFGRTWPDGLLGAYLLLTSLLYLRETTLTDTLRQSSYLFIDIFLPYYVASRALKEIREFKDALLAFVLAAMILALIGVFEYSRSWLLYNALLSALDIHWDMISYLGRGDSLRASASTGHAIVLGYIICIAIGLYLFLQQSIHSQLQRLLGALLLIAGLFATLSRGPWVGAVVILVTFVATGRGAFKNLTLLALTGALTLPLLTIIPGGQKLLNLLPFIGTIETENITYRARLFDNALIVIQHNPWLGSVNFLSTPEMQSMIQGQGIIDIVNSYLNIALETGLIGLALFTSFFASILLGIRKALRSLPSQEEEIHRLGRALLATLAGILIIIATASSISLIPVAYWSVAGLGMAYIQMVRQLKHTQHLGPPAQTPAQLG